MGGFSLILRLFGAVCVLVSLLHLTLGVQADVLLGANVVAGKIDPTIDSQNRFYGIMFGFFGLALILAARNVAANKTLLKLALAVFFCGGLARVLSWVVVGQPAALVVVLLLTELMLPPLLWVWLEKNEGNRQ